MIHLSRSRASLLTGVFAERTGLQVNEKKTISKKKSKHKFDDFKFFIQALLNSKFE